MKKNYWKKVNKNYKDIPQDVKYLFIQDKKCRDRGSCG